MIMIPTIVVYVLNLKQNNITMYTNTSGNYIGVEIIANFHTNPYSTQMSAD